MKDNATELMREVHAAASLYSAAKAAGDYKKLTAAMNSLAELSVSYLERGGSLDELADTFAGEEGKKKKQK